MNPSAILIGIIYCLALTTPVVPLAVGLEPKGRSSAHRRLLVALIFGATQALMALVGCLIGNLIDYLFGELLVYFVFAMMLIVAAKMFVDSIKVLKAKRLYAFTSNWGYLLLGILTSMNTLLMGTCAEGYLPFGRWFFLAVALAGALWAWCSIQKEYSPKSLRNTSFIEFSGAVFMVLIAILYQFTNLMTVSS